MKYNLIKNSRNDINDFLRVVLENRGISEENYEEFMNSNSVDLEGNTYDNLNNIQEGIDVIWKHVENNDMITLVVDPDVDGITSSAILFDYLEKAKKEILITPKNFHFIGSNENTSKINENASGNNENQQQMTKNQDTKSETLQPQGFATTNLTIKSQFYINWDVVTHEGKGHGLTPDININPATKLIILPDGGSNDVEEHKKWHDKGVDIVVIDHHQITSKSEDAIIINNQDSEQYTNKDFSGVGVVYRVLQAFDDMLFLSNADEYLDLISLGNIADVMDTLSYETRYFIQCGIKQEHLKNDFLKLLLKYTKVDVGNDFNYFIYPIDVSFKIAPPLNAMMRLGTAQDKLDVFTCFVSPMELIEGRAGYARKTYNKCLEYKEIQDNERSQLIEVVQSRITPEILQQPVLIIDATNDIENSEIVGLAAMNIASKYNKPVLLGKTKNNYFSGSVRVNNGFPDKEFRKTCEDSGLFGFAQGHNGAFGFGIPTSNISKLREYFDTTYGKMDLQNSYDVDFIINDVREIAQSDFYRIQTNKYLWGRGVEEPLFAMENIPLFLFSASILGEKKDTVKYTYNNIDFMFFKRDPEDEMKNLVEDYDSEINYSINIVGKLGMSTFRGRARSQVIVDDYEIIEENPPELLEDFCF